MKKVLVMMLAIVMCLTVLVACGNNNNTDPTTPDNTKPTVSDTKPTEPSGGDVTDTTEPTNPTDPTKPDATEPTEPSDPEDNTKPPEPQLTKPDIPVNADGCLQLSAMAYDDAYMALRYIKQNIEQYLGKYMIARGVYQCVDGVYTFIIPTTEQYYDANIKFIIRPEWFTDPVYANITPKNGDTVLLAGQFTLDDHGNIFLAYTEIFAVYE